MKSFPSPRRLVAKRQAEGSPSSSPNRPTYFEPDLDAVENIMQLINNAVGFDNICEQDVIDALFLCDGDEDLAFQTLWQNSVTQEMVHDQSMVRILLECDTYCSLVSIH